MDTTPEIRNSHLRKRLVELIEAGKRVVLKHDESRLESHAGDSVGIERLRAAIEAVGSLDDQS